MAFGHTLILTEMGTVFGFGHDYHGQATVPADVNTPWNPVVQVAAGDNYSMVLHEDGTVRCWGFNGRGECAIPAGIGTPENPVT